MPTNPFDMDEEYQMVMYGELDSDILDEMGEFGPDDDYYEEGDFGDDEDWDDDDSDWDDAYDDEQWDEGDDPTEVFVVEKWAGRALDYLTSMGADPVELYAGGKLSNEARDAIFDDQWNADPVDPMDTAREGWNDGWAEWLEIHMGGE